MVFLMLLSILHWPAMNGLNEFAHSIERASHCGTARVRLSGGIFFVFCSDFGNGHSMLNIFPSIISPFENSIGAKTRTLPYFESLENSYLSCSSRYVTFERSYNTWKNILHRMAVAEICKKTKKIPAGSRTRAVPQCEAHSIEWANS